jgi:hypothetical protein
MKISRRNLFAAGGSTAMIAMMGSASSSLAQSAASQTSLDLSTTPDTLGAKARQAMIDIFRKKDATGVDRYFGESFIQHDPTLADGLAGMKSFAAEVASSRRALGGDRSRRRLLICQVARKSTVPLRSLIMRRRRPIGPWYEHTGRRSWSHCVSIGSKSSLKALTMRSTPRKSEMELLG